jgi:competence protein ComEC
MRFLKFPIVRFTLLLILGIVTAHFSRSQWWYYLLTVCIVLLGVQWWFARRLIFQKIYFGLITYLCFFAIGLVNYQSRLPQFQAKHYVNLLTGEEQTIKLEIVDILKPDLYNHKFLAKVHSVSGTSSRGKLLLYLPSEANSDPPAIGDKLLVIANPSEIPPPLNPHQFSYVRFMESQNVYRQVKLVSGSHKLFPEKTNDIKVTIQRFRRNLLQKLDASPFGKEEKGIIEALVLGYRGAIDRDIYKAYAAAGAIHILAVSGLHVGIIYFLLQMLLRPLGVTRHRRALKIFILLITLWGYAAITGLSPSVTRAVTMFTFFGLAQLLNRPTNSMNTLFLSLFFLLIWNPKWLFHVGFQLSYSAVFFILWIHPKLFSLYHPKYYLDKLIWTIITVSLAAQLGVAPLSIYYFNQFPGLFLLSNLVILPFIGILVSTGLLIIVLLSMDLLPQWLAETYNFIISLLNDFVKWISIQDRFLFTDIHFSGYLLLGSYLVIIALVVVWNRINPPRIIFALAAVLVLLNMKVLDRMQTSESTLHIFHKNRTTLIGIQQGDQLKAYTDASPTYIQKEYPLRSFSTTMNIRDYLQDSLPDILSFKSKIILIVDSSGVYPKDTSVDMVLLRGSPKIHLERLINTLRPDLIIADGSNYNSFIARWRKTCELKKLPFHHTGDRGAFTLE